MRARNRRGSMCGGRPALDEGCPRVFVRSCGFHHTHTVQNIHELRCSRSAVRLCSVFVFEWAISRHTHTHRRFVRRPASRSQAIKRRRSSARTLASLNLISNTHADDGEGCRCRIVACVARAVAVGLPATMNGRNWLPLCVRECIDFAPKDY